MPTDHATERETATTRRIRTAARLVRKGLRNPEQIPPFVLGAVFPNTRWAPNWRREDGYVTFDDGGFAGGSPSRPELSARIYNEVSQIRSLLPDERYDRSLEIGCGYGRLSGWIADYAGDAVGVDPNGEAIEQARALYPGITFVETTGDDLPFSDGSFDLIVSWAVLQHVPPASCEAVVDEMTRVLDDDGTILLCERTSGDPGRASWPRSKAEYDALFDSCDLAATGARGTEPTFSYQGKLETMVFANGVSERRAEPEEVLTAPEE